MEAQQQRIFELKDSLEKADKTAESKDEELSRIKGELQEAKEIILKLTEANAKAIEKPPAKPPIRHSGIDVLPRPPRPSTLPKRYTRPTPEEELPQGQQNGMLSNEDIGWVD
jgi:hypothetical protein